MGLNDLVDKVKDWAGKNPDKADQGVDKGSAMLKGKFAGHDQQFDTASEKAKGYLHGPGEGAPGAGAPGAPAPVTHRRRLRRIRPGHRGKPAPR